MNDYGPLFPVIVSVDCKDAVAKPSSVFTRPIRYIVARVQREHGVHCAAFPHAVGEGRGFSHHLLHGQVETHADGRAAAGPKVQSVSVFL